MQLIMQDDLDDYQNFDFDVVHHHLTPDQIELLACLAEEAGEIIQVIGKIQRFGFVSSCPRPHELGQESNHKLLVNELTDLRVIADLLWHNGDIDEKVDEKHAQTKIERLKKNLKYYKIKDNYEFKKD